MTQTTNRFLDEIGRLMNDAAGAAQGVKREVDTVMADRSALQFVGFIFATVTLAVMLTTGMVVKGYADGVYTLDGGRTVIDR